MTGGNRGIGKDITLSLAKMGVGIVLTYPANQAEGDRVVEELQASGNAAGALQLDGATTSSFATFLNQLKALLSKKFGTEKIDLLINKGGFGKGIPTDSRTSCFGSSRCSSARSGSLSTVLRSFDHA